jgi:ligand-binding sensor domain-containing protein/anti-sigma regulatory factor (Ser/Thr protein kinase)
MKWELNIDNGLERHKKEHQAIFFTTCALFLFLFQILIGQEYECYNRYSSDEGLSQNVVNCMIQDKEGFLWLGTQDGLNCFDGYSFVYYQNQPSDSTSISNNYITSLCEDKSGYLWIGTMSGGLNKLDKFTRRFKVYRNKPEDTESISDNTIWSLAVDTSNSIWAGTYKGLNVIREGQEGFLHFRYSESDTLSLPGDMILSLYADSSGNMWVGSGSGLAKFNYRNNNFSRIHPGGKSRKELIIWSLSRGINNTLLLGTNNGVWEYDPPAKFLVKISGCQNNDSVTVWTVMSDGKDQIWYGTAQGIHLFNRSTSGPGNLLFKIPVDKIPEETNAWCLMKDLSGTLWAGTGSGIFEIRSTENTFRTISSDSENRPGIGESAVNAIMVDHLNTLWIGTEGSGLYRLDEDAEKFSRYTSEARNQNTVASDYIWSLFEDREGLIWIGTYGAGLSSYDRSTGQFFNYHRNERDTCAISNNRVFTILEDSSGYIWVGTRGSGLNRYDKRTGCFEEFSNIPSDTTSLSSNIVLTLALDKGGILWVGTFDGGLCRFEEDNKRFKTYKNDPAALSGKPDNCIWTILFDSKNRMWLGTQSGLYVSDYHTEKLSFQRFTTKHGLPGNVIFGLADDKNGNLWMSTFRGLVKLDIQEFENLPFTNDQLQGFSPDPFHPLFKTFDVRDGLQGNEFRQGAYFRNRNGTIYFGGSNGINYFHPDSLQQSQFDPFVRITGFKIFNREVGLTNTTKQDHDNIVIKKDNDYFLPRQITYLDKIVLTWRESVFSFEYAALDFSNTSKNQYAYTMEGFEDHWNFVVNQTSATYTNLDPGEYVFRVRGSNSEGKWSAKEATLNITIIPPFWRTKWFISLSVIFFLLLITVTVTLIFRNQKKKALAEKEKMELQLKTIKNQMDPHFAFNAINMIGSMVYKNDPDKVYDYFSRFARLIRSTLQDSEKISRPLSEELDFVRNYIEIQKTRFADKFTFSLGVIEPVEMETEVPKMIIQTYAENAIKHGLMHKKEGGNLEIKISEKDKRLTISIEDNGIGREKAAELSKESTKKGMQIIQQIFSLYNKLFKYTISQEITDLKDDEGNACGTRVVLTIDKNRS